MEKKLTNDQNIYNLNKRKWLRRLIIAFCLITIFLILLYFVFNISIIFALISFIITQILKKIRDDTPINKNDDLDVIRKEMKKVSKGRK